MNTQTRTHNGVLTYDCRWEVEWKCKSKSKYDRPIATEYFRTHYEAVKRCQKEETQGNFYGTIKYIGAHH